MAGNAGFGAGAFGAGFAKSLTDVLLGNRQKQAAKKEKEFQALLPIHLQLAQETGDYSGVENLISTFDPDLAQTLKKNSPFQQLHKLIGPQLKMSAEQPPMSAGAQPQTGVGGLPLPAAEPPPPGTQAEPTPLPSRTVATEPVPGTTAPPAGSTFFGSPILTPTQRAERQAQATVAADKLQIEARRKIAEQMGFTPDKAVDYALYGTRPPEHVSAEPYKDILDGVDAQGNPVSAVFDQHLGLFLDAITKKPIPGFHKAASAGATTEFDKALASYAKEKNKPVDALSFAERLEARKQYEAAGRAPTAASNFDPDVLAGMAARSPDLLQGLSTTQVGAVKTALGKNPQLMTQYEQARMAPIRAQAQTALDTVNDLLVTKDAKGNPLPDKQITLTPGTTNLYGMMSPITRRLAISGGETATAKAALDQLTGLQVINLITDLKAQSKTGASIFGRLNQQEFAVLQQSATMLKGNISPERARQELLKVREKLQKIMQPSPDEMTPSPGQTQVGPITLDTPVYAGPDGKPTTTPPSKISTKAP